MDTLKQFFGAYFHEDWICEADSWMKVIENYKELEPADTISAAADELSKLINQGLSEKKLENHLFRTLGCYYMPSVDDMSTSQWLQEVRALLAAAE